MSQRSRQSTKQNDDVFCPVRGNYLRHALTLTGTLVRLSAVCYRRPVFGILSTFGGEKHWRGGGDINRVVPVPLLSSQQNLRFLRRLPNTFISPWLPYKHSHGVKRLHSQRFINCIQRLDQIQLCVWLVIVKITRDRPSSDEIQTTLHSFQSTSLLVSL